MNEYIYIYIYVYIYWIYLLCGMFTQELSTGSNEPSSGYVILNYVLVIAPTVVTQRAHLVSETFM